MSQFCQDRYRYFIPRLWLGVAVLFLSACGTNMATKQSGFLSDYHRLSPASGDGGRWLKTPVTLDPAHTVVTQVEWRAKNDGLSPEERTALLSALRTDLQRQLDRLPPSSDGRPAEVRAAITDVSTVSPSLNVLSTAMFAAPLERGGAAIEIEALEAGNHRQLAALSLGYYAPMSDLKARFSKLASAQIALDKAAGDFGPLLHP
ncbi:DUF3313 family protein [Sodalis sp. dw_96]|uniref:DUF3313 family protein n=1 Tax=Sodalis sp. dw_96 TaxID=2719794 RepID=UPI001BD4AE7B|nr:DUF3313 family protein [Sodalis sp. dw_96]